MTDGVASTWRSILHLPSAGRRSRPEAAPASRRRPSRWARLNVVVLAVCLLVVGAMWLRVAEQARFEREEVSRHAIARNEAIVAAFEQYAVQTIENADAVLLAVGREYARAGALIDLDALLTELGIDRDKFQGVGVLDEHGDLIATTTVAGRRSANFADREHFSIHVARDSGRPFVGKPVLSRLLGTMTVPITRRISRADGRFGGVVVVQLEPMRFTEFYRDVTLRPRDVLSLVGLDGITRARRVGDRESSGEDLSTSPLVARWTANPRGSYESAGALDHVERLYSYGRVGGYPLVVTAGSARTDIFADYAIRKSKIDIVAGAATAVIALMAALLLVTLERKRKALATLAASEAQLTAMFRQAATGIARADMQGRLLQVNRRFCEIVGYTEAELLARSLIDITHPDDRLATTADLVELNGTGPAASGEREKRYVRKDGGVVWVSVSNAATRDRLGGAPNVVAMVQDISARKHTEAELREVAKARHLLAECNRILVHATDERSLLRETCAALTGPDGYRLAWIGMAVDDHDKSIRAVAQAGVHPDYVSDAPGSWSDYERAQGTSGRAIRSKAPSVVSDIEADPLLARWHSLARAHGMVSSASLPLCKDGVPFGVLTVCGSERSPFGRDEIALLAQLADDVAYGIVVLRDRAAHALSVASLRESEERTRHYFEMGPMGMAITSPAKAWLDVNRRLCAMLKYDRAELLVTTSAMVTHADDRDSDSAQWNRLISGAIDGYSLEKRLLCRDGSVVDAAVAVSCVHHADGSVAYVLAQFEDITERKRQQLALQRLSERVEQQYRTFNASMSSLSDFAYTLDRNGRFVYANRALLTLWNLELADVIGKDFLALGYPAEQATRLERQVREVVDTGARVTDEMRYADASGAGRDHEYILNPVFDPDGSVEMVAGSTRDITDRKRAEVALRASAREHQQFALQLDVERAKLVQAQAVAKVGSWEADLSSGIVTWSDETHRIFDTDPLLFLPTHAAFLALVHPDDRARVEHAFLASFDTRPSPAIEHRIVMPDGRVKIVDERWQVFNDEHGQPARALGSCQDVTERSLAEGRLRLQSELLAAVGQAVVATDLDGHVIYANRFAEQLYGWTSAEMLGRSAFEVTGVDGSPEQAAEIAATLSAGKPWSGELSVWRRDGRTFPIQMAISPIRDSAGVVSGTIGVSSDITERKASEQQIEYLATHDSLTALTNRNLLDDRLAQAMGHADRSAGGLALLSLDLDHFKFVNDAYGHVVGDALLKSIAQRLRSTVRGADTVARLGGDEFVILLTDLGDSLLRKAASVRSVLDAFAEPFVVDGNEFPVTVSVGVSLYPADGRGLDELLKNADGAMHRVKEMGRNGYQFYAREMSVKAIARVTMESALRQALLLEQFELHYQPLVVITTGDVIGTEALLRWHHPTLGSVAPGDFIPLAEETGLVIAIGDWVLRAACAQNRAWQDAGMRPLTVAVNLSAVQLQQPGFVASVEQALAASGMEPRYLCLELTESMLTGHTDEVIVSLNHLRALGITLSMDDFGTGYSNLSHLTHLPLDILKIDRSFVSDVSTNGAAASIARAIVSMGRSLGMRVVAEGVESVEQAAFLESIWCEHAQGYLYCRPLPAAGFASWMQQRRSGNRAGTPTETITADAVA